MLCAANGVSNVRDLEPAAGRRHVRTELPSDKLPSGKSHRPKMIMRVYESSVCTGWCSFLVVFVCFSASHQHRFSPGYRRRTV